MMPGLLLSGSLLLAVGQSYEFPSRGTPLWFSRVDLLSVQALPGKNLLRPLKPGLIFASGLAPNAAGPLPIHVYSSADVRAAPACAKLGLDFSAMPPLYNGDPKEFPAFAARCPFRELAYAPDYRASWERRLTELESDLLRKGYRLEVVPDAAEGRRTLRIDAAQRRLLEAALGPWLAVYSLQTQEEISKPGRTLLFELSILEVSRKRLESIGLRIPTEVALAVPGSVAGSGTARPQWLPDFLASLRENRGSGRLLAQPRLRVKPGEKARFSSGGELAYRSAQRHGQDIQWKSYGLNLTLEPDGRVATGAGEISVNFLLDFSEPDLSAPGDGPGMLHRKLENRFDLRSGEASVLGTLSFRRQGRRAEGPAGLGWFPALADVLSHHDRSEEDSELWLVLRPSWEEIPLAQYRQREERGP